MRHAEERATLEAFGPAALVAVTDAGSLAARAVVERVVAEFDQACSRFRNDSELSRVNAAAGAAVRVGPVLLEAVTVALRAAQADRWRRRPDHRTGADLVGWAYLVAARSAW